MKKQLLELDPNEIVLHEVKRHPLGLIQIYAVGTFVFIMSLFLLFVILRNQNSFGFEVSSTSVTFLFVMLAIIIVVVTYISGNIYKANELVITNESIIQILQTGLFNRKISQLSLGKIQDVSSDQTGIIPSMFNYGTISIETAGEAMNYRFTFAPNPSINAKHIIEAHEQFIRSMNSTTQHHQV